MKHKKWILGLTTLLIVVVVAGALYAQDVNPNQTVCPVMGGRINKAMFADYNGERVYFCCEPCVESFKKEPQKYLDQLKDQGVVLEKAPITQTKCPVSGEAINKEIHADVNGKRVYFCCNGCKVKFEKDPAKYPVE